MNDPVCGMQLVHDHLVKTSYKNKTYHFCSKGCKKEFLADAEKFLSGKPVIELRDVHKDYMLGEVKVSVLHGLSLKIWKGDFVAIIGQSGSGKTTAMNMIGCLDTPTHGEIYIDGNKTSDMDDDSLAKIRGQKIGFIFQQFNLLSALNCEENVSLPLFFRKGGDTKALIANIDKYISEVGIEKRKKHKPLEMSGGEQQRTAIARALSINPEVILADEPTGNLDSETGKNVMRVLQELNKEGKTLVMITHDFYIAKNARRIMTIKDGMFITDHKDKLLV